VSAGLVRGGVAGFLAAVLLALGVGASGAPAVRQVDKSYDVSGATAEELRNAMNRLGPVGPDGTRFDGYTTWYVAWKYRFNETSGGCRLTRLDVTCDVTTTLPRWANQRDGSAGLKQGWSTYFSALSLHEAGHKDIGVRAAAAVEDEVGRLASQPTCRELEQAVEAKAQGILERFRRDELEYDRTTRHGQAQGARFP
jgi:predicted secreted Zn-dependent protease